MADSVKECDAETGGCSYKQPKYTKNGLRIEIEHQSEQYD